MKRVVILTAGFGDGHNTAARNIAEALELTSDEVKVEVVDLFQRSLGIVNDILKKSYSGLARYAPGVWGSVYALLDSSQKAESRLIRFGSLKRSLAAVLDEAQPDCVVSTYPVYSHVLQEIYKEHSERPFRLVTVITDSISVNSSWYRARSDYFCVPNDATAQVLLANRVAEDQIRAFGFPVSPTFAATQSEELTVPGVGDPIRILYIINTGKKKTGRELDRLLEIPNTQLTITVGRDAELKEKLVRQLAGYPGRVRILGWTNEMPRLLAKHHLVVTKAGGATIQEAIAARCPTILNQIIPGQEEGNARLVLDSGIGAVALKNRDAAAEVEVAFAEDGRRWRGWRDNLTKLSRPEASFRIAELILNQCDLDVGDHTRSNGSPFQVPRISESHSASNGSEPSGMLLCDFHIHSNYSDGTLTVPEIVDFYGQRGFDCICITDHLGDPRRLIGKLSKLLRLTLGPEQLEEYFDVIERERRRAWRKYGMLLMAGIEFNKDGFTKKTSAHLLGVDLKRPINPAMDLPETIAEIHAHGGLAVASHPHIMKSEWGKNTLFLWENQDVYAPLIDAWEIANRNNIFTPIGLKRLSFLANSDFHKPKHIYSWKTLLNCEKDALAIKDCIRKNEQVAITLYRDTQPAQAVIRPREFSTLAPQPLRLESSIGLKSAKT